MKINVAPGVFDIIPLDPQEAWRNSHLWRYVEKVIRDTATAFGFEEIRTPLFERTELFQRGVGETSDIVSKEMYTFQDKGDRSMTLRPEGTAPVMRCFIENQLQNQSPIHKLFYIGPMFRYERAQAGRYRQHHQFGAEAIGSAAPEQDVELIDLIYTVCRKLGLRNLSVTLNCIGDTEGRIAYKKALQDYLRHYYDKLSADSKNRFEANPLRILDSKDPADREIVAGAPSILDYLSDESRNHFEAVKTLLGKLEIPYQVNPLLVRGLDYYNKTVFEIVAGELGAQNSIVGGGRYDGLMKTLGGPDLPCIGFGSGIERLIQTMIKQEVPLPSPNRPTLFLIPLGEAAKDACFLLVHDLRSKGIPVQMDFSGRKLNKVMQYADQVKAKFVAVIGDDELKTQKVELKEMETGAKIKAPLFHLSRILNLDLKSEEFLKMWNEIEKPFDHMEEANFFIDRISRTIKETQQLSLELRTAMEDIKEII